MSTLVGWGGLIRREEGREKDNSQILKTQSNRKVRNSILDAANLEGRSELVISLDFLILAANDSRYCKWTTNNKLRAC